MTIARAKSVSSFHALESETVKHVAPVRNIGCNDGETASLKALAHRILNRNKPCNVDETPIIPAVSPVSRAETPWMMEDYVDWYTERAAIYEFDADLPRVDAEWRALNDVFRMYCEHRCIGVLSREANHFLHELHGAVTRTNN